VSATCLTVRAIPAGGTQTRTNAAVLSTSFLHVTATLLVTVAAKETVVAFCTYQNHMDADNTGTSMSTKYFQHSLNQVSYHFHHKHNRNNCPFVVYVSFSFIISLNRQNQCIVFHLNRMEHNSSFCTVQTFISTLWLTHITRVNKVHQYIKIKNVTLTLLNAGAIGQWKHHWIGHVLRYDGLLHKIIKGRITKKRKQKIYRCYMLWLMTIALSSWRKEGMEIQ